MEVRHYAAVGALFDVIVDDATYNAALSLTTGRIYQGYSGYNAAGTAFLEWWNTIPHASTMFSLPIANDPWITSRMDELIPDREVVTLSPTTTYTIDTLYIGNSEKYVIRVSSRVNDNGYFICSVLPAIANDDDTYTTIPILNSDMPAGFMSQGTISGGTTNKVFYTGILVTNSDMSHVVSITVNGNIASGASNASCMLYRQTFTGTNLANILDWITNAPTYEEGEDPFAEGGESEIGGGDGDFDDESEDVDVPPLPTASATSTALISLYKTTAAQLRSLSAFLWSSAFDPDTFKKLFSDPMGAIMGLSIIPVNPSATSSANIHLGNVDTGVASNIIASQYEEVDCGSVFINEYWGAYLDYSPYTKVSIYLPYIGIRSLDADDVMNKSVSVKYHVDVLSGACVAFIKCGGSVLYEFLGQCATSIPVTGGDWTNMINGIMHIAGAIGTTAVTGGLAAPAGMGAVASSLASNAPGLIGTASSSIVNSMKPHIEKSGSVSGAGGMMGTQTPYLIITRPRQCLPASQNAFIGYPSYLSTSLGDVSGMTVVDSIHLTGVPATDVELNEIESLLKTGVIF